jgi:hypothetical protein
MAVPVIRMPLPSLAVWLAAGLVVLVIITGKVLFLFYGGMSRVCLANAADQLPYL